MKVSVLKLLWLPVLCVFSSCTTLRPIQDFSVDELLASSSYTKTEFDAVGVLTSINLSDSEITLFESQTSSVNLRSIISEFNTTHQIYFYLTYVAPDWRFYDGVSLVGGRIVPTNSLDRNVITCGLALGCRYSETLTMDLDSATFSQATRNGLRFRLNSRYTDVYWEYDLPSNIFQAQNLATVSHQEGS